MSAAKAEPVINVSAVANIATFFIEIPITRLKAGRYALFALRS
jgi:hypothetical protein